MIFSFVFLVLIIIIKDSQVRLIQDRYKYARSYKQEYEQKYIGKNKGFNFQNHKENNFLGKKNDLDNNVFKHASFGKNSNNNQNNIYEKYTKDKKSQSVLEENTMFRNRNGNYLSQIIPSNTNNQKDQTKGTKMTHKQYINESKIERNSLYNRSITYVDDKPKLINKNSRQHLSASGYDLNLIRG